MTSPQSSHDLVQELKPKLPLELLDLIVKFAPVETYPSLVLCNKWLYETCNPLLYQDVYLYAPAQIIKLYESEKARNMMSTTESLFIDEMVLFNETWEGIHTDVDPVEHLIRLLQTTISLRRLEVLQSKASGFQSDPYRSKFAARFNHLCTETESFLPKLERVSVVRSVHWLGGNFFSSNAHPFIFYSLLNNNPTSLDLYISGTLRTATGHIHRPAPAKALANAQSRPVHSLSASDIGLFIQEAVPPKLLRLFAQFMDDPMNDKPLSPDDAFLWIRDVLFATSSAYVETFCIVLGPALVYSEPPLSTQCSILQGLQKVFPALTRAWFNILPLVLEWRRQIPSGGVPLTYPTLPEWTPRPFSHPQELTWWINALNLQVSKTQDLGMLKETARTLREAMLTRWSDRGHVCDEEQFYEQLLAHT